MYYMIVHNNKVCKPANHKKTIIRFQYRRPLPVQRIIKAIVLFAFITFVSTSLILYGAVLADNSKYHMLCDSAKLTGGSSQVYDLSSCEYTK